VDWGSAVKVGRAGVVTDTDLEFCSPQSPLGRALIGATPGEQREYCTPDGIRIKVSVLKAVVHRGEDVHLTPGLLDGLVVSRPECGGSTNGC
jgi:hypothetical protein